MEEHDDKYRIQGVNVIGQTFVLDGQEQIYFVTDSVIRDSNITINVSARNLIMSRVRFIGCTLRFKRPLNNFSFCDTHLEGCQLRGRFSGCEFGRRTDEPDPLLYYPEAGIVDTDLSAAKLDGCRFINCDLSTLHLPRWPCFTVRDPEALREQALQLSWPGDTQVIPRCWNNQPEGTVAMTDHARLTCKLYGGTEEELKAVVSQLPGVIM